MSSTNLKTVWGPLEEEEEEDKLLSLKEDFVSASPNSRVRFSKNRKVVRYPSEQSLMASDEIPTSDEEATVITDEDDFGDVGEDNGEVENRKEDKDNKEEEKENHEDTTQKKHDNGEKPNGIPTPEEVPNGATKDKEVSNDTPPQDDRKRWAIRSTVQRYTPRFQPPPPQQQANNGEDEEEESDSEEEEDEEEASDKENEEGSDGGYDSVQEMEGSDQEEDPIKKIAEESIVSRQQKLKAVQQQQAAATKTTEHEEILKTVSQIKEQLRDEVEKVEQASVAASAAAQQAEENNAQFASRISTIRSFLAVLCGCGVRIVGMLVAAKLLDTAAAQMQQSRSILPTYFLPSIFSRTLPLSPHLVVATGVSFAHAVLQTFFPRLRWPWLAGVDGAVGTLVSICAAALGGARGGKPLGCALVAGCIVGIIASTSSFNCDTKLLTTKSTPQESKQHGDGG